MATQARIVFFSWAGPKHAQPDAPQVALSKWTMRPSQVGNAARRAVTGLVGWRVIGPNNRELGRCVQPATSVEEAHQAVRAAQLSLGRQVSGMLPHSGGSWSWHLSLDSVRIAASSRGYQRQRECVFSLEQFRARFPLAEVVLSPTSMLRSLHLPNSDGVVRRILDAGLNEATT